MSDATWGLQIFLAAAFLIHAAVHLFPPDRLRVRLNQENRPRMRFVANSLETLGALGLVLPDLLHVATWLTGLAALGLLALMISAAAFHLSRREFGAAGLPLIFAIALAFIAWQRIQ